jgi:radical SAM superfamily enzyme YgiQ (UPF0313 family)
MKFSFVNPRPNEPGHTTMTYASPPLGILYIAAKLKQVGVEVSALDQSNETYEVEKVVDWVIKENPDVLGISAVLSSSTIAPEIARQVKAVNSEIVTVFGNHHATHNADHILQKYPQVDIVVRGEGEYTCLELLQCIENQTGLRNIAGITFRHNGQIIRNPDRPLIKDVDTLPFPDRSLLDGEYHNTTIGINVAPKKFTTILSSRGCVFNCLFCSCTSLAKNIWRPRSIDNIMDELHFLASEGFKQLMFVDDNFTLNQQRVIELCKRIRKERIDIEWIAEGRVDQCSYTLFKEMVKAGCRMLYFGIESANQHVLDYYNKGITPQQSQKTLKIARKAGIDILVGSFIIGAPNETKHDIQKTFTFIKNLEIDIPQINLLQANPGTPLWNDFKRNGLLDEALYWESGVYISDISPETVPRRELVQMVNHFYQNLLKNSNFLLKQTWRTLTSRYRLNLVLNNLARSGEILNVVHNLTSHQYTLG